MQINVAIIEDNPITAKDLAEILEKEGMAVNGMFNNAKALLERLKELDIDVLLVDIKLKGPMDGIELVKAIRPNKDIPIVYLTANSDAETVRRALDTTPSSFLTKPFDEREVSIAIELAFANHLKHTFAQQNGEDKCLYLKSNDRFEKVALSDILYFEAEGSYCKIITSTKKYLLSGNLNHYYAQVNKDQFIRIHRSYVVNLQNICGLNSDHVFIGKRSLPIGRSHKMEVKKALKRLL